MYMICKSPIRNHPWQVTRGKWFTCHEWSAQAQVIGIRIWVTCRSTRGQPWLWHSSSIHCHVYLAMLLEWWLPPYGSSCPVCKFQTRLPGCSWEHCPVLIGWSSCWRGRGTWPRRGMMAEAQGDGDTGWLKCYITLFHWLITVKSWQKHQQ